MGLSGHCFHPLLLIRAEQLFDRHTNTIYPELDSPKKLNTRAYCLHRHVVAAWIIYSAGPHVARYLPLAAIPPFYYRLLHSLLLRRIKALWFGWILLLQRQLILRLWC